MIGFVPKAAARCAAVGLNATTKDYLVESRFPEGTYFPFFVAPGTAVDRGLVQVPECS